MPPNTVKVDRSTKWGNPFKVGDSIMHPVSGKRMRVDSKECAIATFADYLRSVAGTEVRADARRTLKGKHLACWCKDGDACHADLLLKVANGGRIRRAA